MSDLLTLHLHDLVSLAKLGKLQPAAGRDDVMGRLSRLLWQRTARHVIVSGQPGAGKTRLLEGLAYNEAQGQTVTRKMYRLDSGPLVELLSSGGSVAGVRESLQELVGYLESGVLILEDVQFLTAFDVSRREALLYLLEPLLLQQQVRVVMIVAESALGWLREDERVNRFFTMIRLEPLYGCALRSVVQQEADRLGREYRVTITTPVIDLVIAQAVNLLDRRAASDNIVRLLEEACAITHGDSVLPVTVRRIVQEQQFIPRLFSEDNQSFLRELEVTLKAQVIGQEQAINVIMGAIQRVSAGLSDPDRPRGSFLLLGPSGVGKTETAKALATAAFGSTGLLVRLDMSEYGEAHSAVRLIGSPPGYVGYEAGGQLTGPVAQNPYSLLLLDEIEKAHPKLFDLFLQVLDDGRLTDGRGQTVDFRNTMILATSNVGAEEIIQLSAGGHDWSDAASLQRALMPLLRKHFRPEFLNRFDGIVVYPPLSVPDLVSIARLELDRLQSRLGERNVGLCLSDAYLTRQLQLVADPLLGARPVRRFIQQQVEVPLAQLLLLHPETRNLTITEDLLWTK